MIGYTVTQVTPVCYYYTNILQFVYREEINVTNVTRNLFTPNTSQIFASVN